MPFSDLPHPLCRAAQAAAAHAFAQIFYPRFVCFIAPSKRDGRRRIVHFAMYCCIISPGGDKNRIVESHWSFRMNADLFHVSSAASDRDTIGEQRRRNMQSRRFPAAHPMLPWSEKG
jgi:hypothetical protein